MWAPGTYLPDRGEGDAVHANIGVEKYFFAAGDRILNRIKEHRNTAILPERTGPIADVLYSAAGNSADEHWYKRDVIAYSFETGADLYFTTLQSAAPAGAPGIRLQHEHGRVPVPQARRHAEGGRRQRQRRRRAPSRRSCGRTRRARTRTCCSRSRSRRPTRRACGSRARRCRPASASSPTTRARASTRRSSSPPATTACSSPRSSTPATTSRPRSRMAGPRVSREPFTTTFEFVNEPSVIRYSTDGKKPTDESPLWDSTGPREPGRDVPHHRDDDVPVDRDGHQGQRLRPGREKFNIVPGNGNGKGGPG